MDFNAFSIATTPRLAFGEGRIAELPAFIGEYGRKVLLVTGAQAFRATAHWSRLQEDLTSQGIAWETLSVTGEPSPTVVDDAVRLFHGQGIEVVVGIGGGSVIDAAKAIAGLLPRGDSVLEYLEDVGRGLPYPGPSVPFIAVPTTAGTGSEATKNAVLSMRGHGGYKKSFRHEQLVARVALVDPALLASCPAAHVAAQGMDAFTQLLESYLSVRANPFTDALALSGLAAVKEGFLDAWRGGDTPVARKGRAAMAYAAYVSGVTLAQVGLGSVHGLAQPLGAFFPVPHGVACGTTVAAATAVNIAALRERDPQGVGLRRYAEVGRLLSDAPCESDAAACDALLRVLEEWTRTLDLPRLSAYGVSEADLPRIVQASRNNSMKTNPVLLADEEIAAIVRARL
jgi:alcohol dehydrogenase